MCSVLPTQYWLHRRQVHELVDPTKKKRLAEDVCLGVSDCCFFGGWGVKNKAVVEGATRLCEICGPDLPSRAPSCQPVNLFTDVHNLACDMGKALRHEYEPFCQIRCLDVPDAWAVDQWMQIWVAKPGYIAAPRV